jgi:type I restriction enzyme S subunit
LNYQNIRLDEACDIIMGQAPSGEAYNDVRKGWPLVAGAGDFGNIHPRPKKYTTEAAKLSREGDIILGVRASIGDKVWSDSEYCLGRGVAGLRARLNLNRNYLWHWLDHIRPEIERKAKGATFKQVTREDIAELPFSLLPLDEQNRIATILDKADGIRKNRSEVIAASRDFLRSAFLELFGDPVTNSKRLPEKPIAELATVTTGNTPSREIDAYFGDHIEWIKSDNINTPSHFLTKSTEGLSVAGLKVARSAPAGSTLITCIAGSPSCIGNAALADRKVSFNQQINALTPKPGIEPEFIYAATLFSKPRIQAASTNGMKGMVSKGALEQVRFILPPQDQRQQFVGIFQKVMELRLKLDNAEREADSLYGSLAQRAFQGKL